MIQHEMKMSLKFVWTYNILKWRWMFHKENDEVVVMREMNEVVMWERSGKL